MNKSEFQLKLKATWNEFCAFLFHKKQKKIIIQMFLLTGIEMARNYVNYEKQYVLHACKMCQATIECKLKKVII